MEVVTNHESNELPRSEKSHKIEDDRLQSNEELNDVDKNDFSNQQSNKTEEKNNQFDARQNIIRNRNIKSDPKHYFFGFCFSTLRNGDCTRTKSCPFYHEVCCKKINESCAPFQ